MAAKKLYIVRWRSEHFFDETAEPQVAPNDPRRRLAASFLNRQDAEQFKREIERGRRSPPDGANPFLAFRRWRANSYDHEPPAGLAAHTSMPEAVFHDWLQDLGLALPSEEHIEPQYGKPFVQREWDRWWESNAPSMTEHQRRKVWEALDKLDFFEIVETELAD